MSNPIRLRQAPERTGNRRDALDNGGPRRRDFALLEGDHRQRRKSVEQFAGAEQEIGVVRAPEPLVAARKGLLDLHPPGASAPEITGNNGRCK